MQEIRWGVVLIRNIKDDHVNSNLNFYDPFHCEISVKSNGHKLANMPEFEYQLEFSELIN